MEEGSYRQSRLCRLLGNPVAFAVVQLLAENRDMSTSEIAKAVGRSVSRISNVLAALRLADVVRYETEGRQARYRLKHPREARKVLDALSGFVKTASADGRIGYFLTFAIAKTWKLSLRDRIQVQETEILPSPKARR